MQKHQVLTVGFVLSTMLVVALSPSAAAWIEVYDDNTDSGVKLGNGAGFTVDFDNLEMFDWYVQQNDWLDDGHYDDQGVANLQRFEVTTQGETMIAWKIIFAGSLGRGICTVVTTSDGHYLENSGHGEIIFPHIADSVPCRDGHIEVWFDESGIAEGYFWLEGHDPNSPILRYAKGFGAFTGVVV